MNYTIKNQYLAVEISSSGGELRSVRDSEGTEYLWQGDPDSWEERGPNLFPYIGRTTRQTYTYQGKEYHMPLHGFLIGSEMELADRTDDSLSLCLKTSQKTLVIWPFHFCLTITWKLDGSTLSVSCQVENQDEKTMYFGIGGHPGFHIPMDSSLVFDDYRIDFGKNASPQQILLSDDCFILEKNVPLELEEGRYLPLSHELFARDAIVMKNMPKEITIESPKSHRKIHATFPDMDYLGLWNCGNAPFVCIEPWSSLPSRKDLVEDLETQPNLISLKAGKKYVNTWSVSVISDIEN
ncbi:aldose 1-epimerase family protein [uncultured Blautia sp.]|uniref:aldose 1-epimerase family protein n=1 Tax=uncultured Blautia sp. TaxID=765821 RepID=UPI00280A8332|nr:aldose 1-epimerase family protein [uncultured Blautia sp.]